MFKTIIVIIIAIAAFAYFNDPKSLQPWSEIVSDAGKATAKAVKRVGEETGDKLHKMTRDDSTILDHAKNSIEDTASDTKNKINEAVDSK